MVSSPTHELAGFRYARTLVDTQLQALEDITITPEQFFLTGVVGRMLFALDVNEDLIDDRDSEALTRLFNQLYALLQGFSHSESVEMASAVIQQIEAVLGRYAVSMNRFQKETSLDDEAMV
jgi:hypothetical protein